MSRSAKPKSGSPMTRLVRVAILIFSLYGIASSVHAKQAVKQLGAASAVVSESANTGKVSMSEMLPTKGLQDKGQAEKSDAIGLGGYLIYAPWIFGTIMAIFAFQALRISKEERAKKNTDTAKKRETDLQVEKIFKTDDEAQEQIIDAKRYSDRLKEEFVKDSIFEMPGIDGDKATVNPLDTFIPLDLTVDTLEKQRPVTVLQNAVSSSSRMLLIKGEPGSGKTTIIKHFALNRDITLLGFASPLPILYMPLRKMDTHGDERKTLPEKLSECFLPNFKIKASFFENCLENEKTLVLLDGLDEISDKEQRKKVCEWVYNISKTWTKAFIVMTTRDKGYGEQEQRALRIDKQIAYVHRFDEDQQRLFLLKWFRAAFLQDLYRQEKNYNKSQSDEKKQEASEYANALDKHLAKPEHKGMRDDLAGIPMLLHLMAILWKQSKIIPKERENLYDIALDYLLYYREKEHQIIPLLPAAESKRLLKPLSLWMQDENEDAANIVEFHKRIQVEINHLSDYEYRKHPAAKICEDFVTRAGVLDQMGFSYVFSHKTFREYFAGLQLARSITFEPKRIGMLVDQIGIYWWDEPLLFFVTQVDSIWFNELMKAFFDSPRSESLDQQTLNFLLKLISKAPKDVEVFRDKLLTDSISKDKQFYILKCLQTIATPEAVDAAENFIKQHPEADKELLREAYAVIASGDRDASILLDLNLVTQQKLTAAPLEPFGDVHFSPVEQNAQYILIKKGRYSEDGKEQVGDLYVAKYPVTNKLYRKFVSWLQSVEKREAEDILSVGLVELAQTNSGFKNYLEEEIILSKRFRSTLNDDRRFKEDDQPVVGVSWYDARTYCLWLSLMESNGQEANHYRLPREQEWEYAAAGKETRDYPWPDDKGEANSKLLNYNGNVGATTPVGSYPEGATPEGLYDMAGNVWEWTDSWYDKTGSLRVIRGGGWGDAAECCRSAYRNSYTPDYRLNYVGFRLVFVP